MKEQDNTDVQYMLNDLYKSLGVLSYQIKYNKEQLLQLKKSFKKTCHDINECQILLNQK